MIMKTKDNCKRPQHSERLSILFSPSVQHRTKCIMNTKNNSLFIKRMAIHGHFWARTNFLCAGGPATPDMLLQFKCRNVSMGPFPTPVVVNHPTRRSCIRIQGTTNGNENKGQWQQAAPL